MIEVYSMDKNENFFWNVDIDKHADYILNPISATISMELYGEYVLNVTCPLSDYMKNNEVVFGVGSVLVVDMLRVRYPRIGGWSTTSPRQLFSIYNITVNNYEVSFQAEPILNRLLRSKYAIDVRPTDLSSAMTVRYVVDNSFGNLPMYIDYSGSGMGTHTAYYIEKTGLEAIKGTEDNTLTNRWETFVLPDNSTVVLVSKQTEQAQQTPVWTFGYGKDLTGLNVQYDGSAIVRWARPVAYNGRGMSLNYTHTSGLAQNGGVWSPHNDDIMLSRRGMFSPKKRIDFENIKLREDVTEGEDTTGLTICNNQSELNVALYNATIDMFNNKGIDTPQITIDIDIVNLERNMEVQSEYKSLLKNNVSLGSVIKVESSPHNVDIKTKVIAITYDCTANQITKLTLSNTEYDFFTLMNYSVNTSKNIYTNRA